MDFRPRDYRAEDSAFSLPRTKVEDHPLTTQRTPLASQVNAACHENDDFEDPLRARAASVTVSSSDAERSHSTFRRSFSDEIGQTPSKEWALFTRSLLQKSSSSGMISISWTSDTTARNVKEYNKSVADVHMEELEDPEILVKEEKKVITQQEYASRLQELKGEIGRAWKAEDRIKALKLSIKVSRLLIDTSVLQFYPTLFLIVIEILDMFGELVWERIKRKAEYSEDGALICSLPEDFFSGDVCPEAKETCHNWFCKIGSIRELLPRIYLELAILRCWRFLEDHHLHNLQRLTEMMRGLADPLASSYCHLYLTHRAALLNCKDIGYLILSISNINSLLKRIIFVKEGNKDHSDRNRKLQIKLLEPAIEWTMKCLFMEGSQKPGDILLEFGFGSNILNSSWNIPWTSIIIHHLLRQLPKEIVCAHGLEMLEFFERISDISLDQHLNYRLLGLKLSESQSHFTSVESILNKVIKVLSQCSYLEEYLVVADAYLEIILLCSMDDVLSSILDGIINKAENRRVHESELNAMQSILMKLLKHFNTIETAFSSEHFMAIHDLLTGTSLNVINIHILEKATRTFSISDPTTVQKLFEISKAIHDSIDILNDDYQQKLHLISRFVQMVDFGDDRQRQLTFLAACREAFSFFDIIKDTLVHLSNNLAVRAIRGTSMFLNFVKACVAFSEVTIPSVSNQLRCMNLYLETAEIALFGGLVSHAEGLVNSAIDCLLCLGMSSGTNKSIDEDHILSLVCKLCSILIFVPGIDNKGIAHFHRRLISIVDKQSLNLSRMTTTILCGVILLCASTSQNQLPIRAKSLKVFSNNELFFGDQSYKQELSSVTADAIEKLFNAIEQESGLALRGKLALEACNCLIFSFKAGHELHVKCSKLIQIARSCVHPKDKYLQSTVNFFDDYFRNLC